ncbi:MAG: response regulator, partial [Halioglobus sp.]
MSHIEQDYAFGWEGPLLRELDTLRQSVAAQRDALADITRDDFDHLFEVSERLQTLLAESRDVDRHDLMNILAAMRGYGEMLREDVGQEHPVLDATLSAMLGVISSASHTEEGTGDTGDRQVIATDPGFILAVDDRRENRELVARNLSRLGHFVVTAASGEEALGALEQSDVDVVLLDLLMPGMDGREVLRRIKERPEWRATPVIVISGSQDMDGIIECIEAGADDYLFKPFNPVLLQARIKAGIERKRWHDREE